MSEFSPIGSTGPAGAHGPAPTGLSRYAGNSAQPVGSPTAASGDSVELSAVSRLLARMDQIPAVRQDLIDEIKGQIDGGSYETEDKLNAAIEALIDDL